MYLCLQEGDSTKIEVQRFWRPDDISQEQAYKADFWDVYASNEQIVVDKSEIVSKCIVSLQDSEGVLIARPCIT